MSEMPTHQKPTIKLISESFVKPKFEIESAKKPYYLGPIDLIVLLIDPIQKGLLYKLNHNTQHISSINLLEKLKHSLSIALVHFYPLAGRFTTRTYAEENASSVFIDCTKGLGARLIHAKASDICVSSILSPNDVTIVRPLFDLGEKSVNYDGHTKALLSIQVTELIDGVFIGFSMNHSVVDGTSFTHFVNMLDEIFRAYGGDYNKSISNNDSVWSEDCVTNISRVPVFNYRPWLSYFTNNKEDSDDDAPLVKFNIEELINREYNPGPLRERMFHFSKVSMAKLKAKVNQECGTQNVISSFLALTALVWKSITQARKLAINERTTCFMAIGVRSRFDPPVSEDYFGNYISMAQWACDVGELLNNDLGWAAMNLQKIIKAQDTKAIIDIYKLFFETPILKPRGIGPNIHGENCVIMGGSSRFDMYGAEFGLGRALATRMGYGNKEDGKVTANCGCEGGGSVDLEICLRPHFMDALEANQEFMSFVSLE